MLKRIQQYVRLAVMCIFCLALIFSVFWILSYSWDIHRRHEAESMLRAIKFLRSKAYDRTYLDRIAHEFHGYKRCSGNGCFYVLEEHFDPKIVQWRTEWDYLGLRPWRLYTRIETRDNEVSSLELDMGVSRGRGWLFNQGPLRGNMWASLLYSVRVSDERFRQQADAENRTSSTGEESSQRLNGILIDKPSFDTPGGGEALETILSPMAVAGSTSVAFDISLRCTTTFSACYEPCQLAPSAWRSYLEDLKSRGLTTGEPEQCLAR